jgi:tetratricopeptide (TPR) repeat protein
VLFAATAASGGLTLLLFGNTFLGLARDWDVGAFALLGTVLLALALWTEYSVKSFQRAVLPVLTAAILSNLLLWISVNTQDRASAQRFEDIAAMDAGLILPMNTFTAYENLRKFYQSGRETQSYFRVLRLQVNTGYRSHIGYAEYLSSLLQLSDPALRRAELEWLLDRYEKATAVTGKADDFRVIPLRDAREFAARMLLSAWQIGERELTGKSESFFRTRFAYWPEIDLLDILRGTNGAGENDLERIAAAVSPETRDAFLHMTAGGLYQQRGSYESAAAAYDAALEREPALYPSWYLVAANLHLTVTEDREKARQLLERCIENAPSSQEAIRASEILGRK